MAFVDLWSELCGTIPRLPPNLAQTFVNRAWTDIRDYRLWSWLVAVGYITTPVAITTGTADVVLGSASVTFSAGAATALNAVALANPPLANAQIGIGRQFRLSSSTSGTPGPIYSIIAWDGVSVATLDRVYAESTGTANSYTAYKCYYSGPPSNGTGNPNVLRYASVTNTPVGYTIRGRKLYYTQPELDALDPQRGATGDSYILASYEPNPSVDSDGITGPEMFPVWEWYPHPVYSRVYKCIYQKRIQTLSDTQDLPVTIPSSVLMARAFVHGGQWALSQVSIFPELSQSNWVQFITVKQQEYKETLLQCIKQDDEIFVQRPFIQGAQFDFPLGGSFVQSHDVSSIVGGGW